MLKPRGSIGRLATGSVWLNSAQLSSGAAPVFSDFLSSREIKNPFPGLPRAEKMIGRKIVARIGSNECMEQDPEAHPLGFFLSKEMLDLCRLYPDPYATSIRTKLAALTGTPEEEIITDTGADSLLCLALRMRVTPGDAVVTSAGTYPTFSYFALGAGCTIHEVDYLLRNDAEGGGEVWIPDLAGIADAAHAQGAVVAYLANPDNPTGHVFSTSEVGALRAALPVGCTLLLDEAYIDFAPAQALTTRLPNTVQTRTLSKAWGLAGLRLGYALASPEWVLKADTVRTQFSASGLSHYLVEKVLDAPGFSSKLVHDTIILRNRLREALVARGCRILPSATNFVAVLYPSPEQAAARHKELLALGIAVHRPPHTAMQRLLRVTASPLALDPAVLAILAV